MNGQGVDKVNEPSCGDDLHCREMAARIDWAVRLRWFFVAAILVMAGLLSILGQSLRIGVCFLAVGCALAVANLLVQRRLTVLVGRSGSDAGSLRQLCLAQVVGDYLALSVVAYALGTVETPVMFLVLPNCILVALYFPPLQSLVIALLGLGLVLLPLVLEFAGVLAPVSLFAPAYRQMLVGSPLILGMYLGVLVCCVLFCWYLAGVIRHSLLANEEEIEARYRQLLAVSREKTSSVLHGAHELKAPLAAIRSYASTMRDGYAGALPAKALHVVERIGVRCDRLLAMISDIIRLGNLQSPVRVGEVLSVMEPASVLREVVEEVAAVGRDREIRVRLEVVGESAEARVRATAEHLQTMFLNLLLNAVQYSRPGEEVVAELSVVDGRVTVSVRDQGIGIAAGDLPRIFSEYYRAPDAVRHHDGGDGLGLAIVKATVALLGAEIEVVSEVGRGTVFTVLFPLLPDQGCLHGENNGREWQWPEY